MSEGNGQENSERVHKEKHRSRKGSFPFLFSSHTPHFALSAFYYSVCASFFYSIVVIIIIIAIIAIDIVKVVLLLPCHPLHSHSNQSRHPLSTFPPCLLLVKVSIGLYICGTDLSWDLSLWLRGHNLPIFYFTLPPLCCPGSLPGSSSLDFLTAVIFCWCCCSRWESRFVCLLLLPLFSLQRCCHLFASYVSLPLALSSKEKSTCNFRLACFTRMDSPNTPMSHNHTMVSHRENTRRTGCIT